MAADWTDEELRAAITAYRVMAAAEASGQPYSKRAAYRELGARFKRTEKAFEYRMQNISAVLDSLGRPWLPGLKPASHVGEAVKQRIAALLDEVIPTYRVIAPDVRRWLIEVARARGVVTYGEVMASFGVGHRDIRRLMDVLGHESQRREEPIITALIVNAATRRSSGGLGAMFGVGDDAAEREKLYEYWEEKPPEPVEQASPDESIEVKAARFVSVEVRPNQAAFRRRVFLACGGRCIVSGCDVPAALDAAHKVGRKWKGGYNRTEDGYLLRKDLHALYDAGLLTIEDGRVRIAASVGAHYVVFDGVTATLHRPGDGN